MILPSMSLIIISLLLEPIESKSFWFRQSINLPALKQVGAALFKPGLLIPSIELRSINDLDLDALYTHGARVIVFDKDNTLSIPFQDTLEGSLVDKMKLLRASPFRGKMAILSNSAGSCDDDNFRMAAATEKGLDMPVIKHVHKKPKCLDEVLAHFGGSISPGQICMVGDRLLTDVMFGNMHGMITVLVSPLSIKRDHFVAVLIRSFERWFILPLAKLFLWLLRLFRRG